MINLCNWLSNVCSFCQEGRDHLCLSHSQAPRAPTYWRSMATYKVRESVKEGQKERCRGRPRLVTRTIPDWGLLHWKSKKGGQHVLSSHYHSEAGECMTSKHCSAEYSSQRDYLPKKLSSVKCIFRSEVPTPKIKSFSISLHTSHHSP